MQPSQDKVLQLLFRSKAEGEEINQELESYLDRLLLRIFSSTSLISYLYDAGTTKNGEVEVVFNELPEEIVDKVVALIGAENTKVFSFRDDDTQHTYHGFRSKPQAVALEQL